MVRVPLSPSVSSPHGSVRRAPVLEAFTFAGEVAGLTPGPVCVSRVQVRVREFLR